MRDRSVQSSTVIQSDQVLQPIPPARKNHEQSLQSLLPEEQTYLGSCSFSLDAAADSQDLLAKLNKSI